MGKLYRKTIVPADLETCWDFFSSPENLAKITPEEMDFVIKDFDGKKMYEGQQISYTVKPLAGLPMKWKTLITSVRDRKEFVDLQLEGPYKLWHHLHIFRETKEGVEMIDIVNYKAPFGFLGRIMEKILIDKKVKGIFDHREIQIRKIFTPNAAAA